MEIQQRMASQVVLREIRIWLHFQGKVSGLYASSSPATGWGMVGGREQMYSRVSCQLIGWAALGMAANKHKNLLLLSLQFIT